MWIVIDIAEEVYKNPHNYCCCTVADCIKNAKPLPKGKWICRHIVSKDKIIDIHCCSECGTEFSYDAETGVSITDCKICPNCNAIMRIEKE